jgi:hypothetical protein
MVRSGVILGFLITFYDSGTISQKGLNINGQQFHQYQQNEQSLHVWFRQLK